MKRLICMTAVLFLLAGSGCKPQHPSVITMEPDFDPGKVGTILCAPAVSSITRGEDPNRESERMVNRIMWDAISYREDYSFLSPEQFRLAVNRAKLGTRMKEFNDGWSQQKEIQAEFMDALRSMNVDLILIPHVYLWNKDEADYRESATASATQVGITISLVDLSTGRIMWEATDENYKESVRTEGDRVQAQSGGIDRRVAGKTSSGKDVYSAPPFEDVAVLVLEALIAAVPEKIISLQ